MKARKHFHKSTMELLNGKMLMRKFPFDGNVRSLYLLLDQNEILLSSEPDGYSVRVFEPNQTYRIKVMFEKDHDIDMAFSSSELTQELVNLDFNIRVPHNPWRVEDDLTLVDVPSGLMWFLGIFNKYNTKRLENSRRLIVSLMLHTALSVVDNHKLCIDEETNLEVIKETTRESKEVTIKYHGMLDFVVGHSPTRGVIAKDVSLLAVEVKAASTFEDGFKQALAQAATSLVIREEAKRGMDESGGPVYFILSDGKRWIFAELAYDEDQIVSQYSAEFSIHFDLEEFEKSVQKVFSIVVKTIKLSQAASPRVSKTSEDIAEMLSLVTVA
ncbi:hypothetical protein EDD86DRAFT_213814 [Gorgonomyces haynaldii]|nr:hypothetical protein EDD86DRAFT_213814 [Gorgonomyces haynaldii]